MTIGVKTRVLLGSAAGAIACYGAPAFANTDTQGSGAATATTEAEGGLETIVVTARRRAENLQDTPVSVTAFSSERLETMNVQEVSKIANFTPGLELVPPAPRRG